MSGKTIELLSPAPANRLDSLACVRADEAFVGKGSLRRNAPHDSCTNHRVVKSKFLNPASKRLRSPLVLDKEIAAPVSRLFSICRPSTIGRLVVSVVIDSIKRVFVGWLSPHVGEKAFKAVSPFTTHGNAARAVVFVLRVSWRVAPAEHLLPRFVLRRASGLAVSFQCLSKAIESQASAGRCVAASNRTCVDRRATSTVALTGGNESPFAVQRNNCEPSEFIAHRDVEVFSHGVITGCVVAFLIIPNHDGGDRREF
jgi:hypothetical protein